LHEVASVYYNIKYKRARTGAIYNNVCVCVCVCVCVSKMDGICKLFNVMFVKDSGLLRSSQ